MTGTPRSLLFPIKAAFSPETVPANEKYSIRTPTWLKIEGFQREGRKCVSFKAAAAAVMHELKFCFNELWISPLCLEKAKVSHHNYAALQM